MPTIINVNDKIVIKKIPTPKYFHCYKLNDSSYAFFDIKMDMPIIIGSIAIIKSIKLPSNSTTFYYEINKDGYFEKGPEKTIKVGGDGTHTKPPLRFHDINKKNTVYHLFILSTILSVLWDDDFSMPITYGSNQRIQSVINQLPKNSTIFYYKEDVTVKNSFKLYMTFKGNVSKF